VFGFVNAADPAYAVLKRECELRLGSPSQCFDAAKITNPKKATPGYFLNVLLKVNAKLGGVNHHAPDSLPAVLRAKPTLVLGADVYHDPAAGRRSHSAFVGSHDAAATQYGGVVQQQGSREECVPFANAKRAAKYFILEYMRFTKTTTPPAQIVYLRDGVSDRQVLAVIESEVAAILAAAEEVKPGYVPQLLALTAVKRHHVRFSGISSDAIDKSGNLQSGTVVDTEVVRPDLNEFFLFGHAGLKGTSRPCLYQVIYNGTAYDMDAAQELVFYLSHLHQRASRAVSLPAPVYYAHLLAYRARYYAGKYAATGGERDVDGAWGTNSLVPALMPMPFYL